MVVIFRITICQLAKITSNGNQQRTNYFVVDQCYLSLEFIHFHPSDDVRRTESKRLCLSYATSFPFARARMERHPVGRRPSPRSLRDSPHSRRHGHRASSKEDRDRKRMERRRSQSPSKRRKSPNITVNVFFLDMSISFYIICIYL